MGKFGFIGCTEKGRKAQVERSDTLVVKYNLSKAALPPTRVLLLTYQRAGVHYLFTGPQFVYFLKISKNLNFKN